ncbi:MAG: Glu/Leu/Phe/Val dehydrogenase, partial [Saprospiraceae bacterium]|nr:Glu/Leu/Phe/Val dehydrogenase [Saprospiraceae bacterium]
RENEIDAAGCVTGKPVALYGIQGRTEATGRGVFYGLREACDNAEDMKRLKLQPGLGGKTMIIQGMGNVGSYSGTICQEEGGVKVIGVGEWDGAIYLESGIDVNQLLKVKQETGSITNYPGAKVFSKEDRNKVLEMPCDILVPAALENQITVDNAKNIKAKIIAEAANGPITSGAEEILLKKGTLIIPDVFLNAGGVTVSYFEWLKNLSHMRFGRMEKRFNQTSQERMLHVIEDLTGRKIDPEILRKVARGADEVDLVRSGLEETMSRSYNFINEFRQKNGIDMRTAAFAYAIQLIGNDYQNLGIFP